MIYTERNKTLDKHFAMSPQLNHTVEDAVKTFKIVQTTFQKYCFKENCTCYAQIFLCVYVLTFTVGQNLMSLFNEETLSSNTCKIALKYHLFSFIDL